MPEADVEYVHPDHWSPEQRELIAHLRALHLPGVDADDEALTSGTIEQARLLLVTSGGLLALTLTKLLDLNRSVCAIPIIAELATLLGALFLGWLGLLVGLRMRKQRVDRRYDILNAHIDAHMQSLARKQDVDLTRFDYVFDTAFDPERKSSTLMGRLRLAAVVLTSIGIAMAALAVIGTIAPDRCLGALRIGGLAAPTAK